MSNTPRDTQFAGFAEKLYQEIQDMAFSYRAAPDLQELKRRECEIIARRAYDLACHVVTYTLLTAHGDMGKVPDLTELLKEHEI